MRLSRRKFLEAAIATAATTAPLPGSAQSPPMIGLEARESVMRHDKGAAPTPIWGFGGQSPGPILRIRQGERLAVRLLNQLKQPTSIHWRGVRGPNNMDGVAGLTQEPVPPGGHFDYVFVPPDAGTFIYQAHAAPFASEQIHRGMSGLLIVDEKEPFPIDTDVPVAIADWRLDAQGMLSEPIDDPRDARMGGRIGPLVTIGGLAAPVRLTLPPGARVRLRIANLAPARIAALTISGAKPLIIAIDSQPCPSFEPANQTILVAPGARFDVLCDLPRQTDKSLLVIMRSWPLPGQKPQPAQEIFEIRTSGLAVSNRPPAANLATNNLLPDRIRLQDAMRLNLVIAQNKTAGNGWRQYWSIGGKSSDGLSGPPLFTVRRGSPVSLGLINKSAYPQVLRLHGHAMRILHRFDDGWDPYWRDTVIIPPSETVRIAFLATNPGKWRIGSGLMAYAEAGLAGWFEVQ